MHDETFLKLSRLPFNKLLVSTTVIMVFSTILCSILTTTLVRPAGLLFDGSGLGPFSCTVVMIAPFHSPVNIPWLSDILNMALSGATIYCATSQDFGVHFILSYWPFFV